ncbi:cytochrome b5 [Rhizodiscina lignyota]|uniref:Cytochrome b5 n=1 Tax=Rhizodiscina lignyota TaxID=1504668 RepID=A0A9P4IQU4_9PEZI|nr:cytochrome b5 [Rhizodiscina lignyota]
MPMLILVKGKVFDVTGNTAYSPKGSYHVFTGKDASRALALSSLKPEDCRPEWEDLEDKDKKVLDDWMTFFSKRYNVVGQVQGASNL